MPQVAPGTRLRCVKAESLSGVWHEETRWNPGEQEERVGKASPCTGAAFEQDKLEPVLRAAAVACGVTRTPVLASGPLPHSPKRQAPPAGFPES